MNPAQTISDQQLDQMIDAVRPGLRGMLRNALTLSDPCSMLRIGLIPLKSGQQWEVVIAVLAEPFARMAKCALLDGWGSAMQSYEKLQAPTPQGAGGFQIPGV